MALLYWLGTAPAVAQQTTVAVTAFDAATSYRVAIGTSVVAVPGDTDNNTTAAALAAAITASAAPEFTGITASASTSTVTITGIPGLPFTATSSVSGGTGTIGAATQAVAPSGPNFWSAGANWSTGSIPANGDDVVIDGGPSICWGIAQSAVALNSLRITQSYTERIGLDRRRLALSPNALNSTDAVGEYRPHYLAIGAGIVEIGERIVGGPALSGSSRIMLDLGDDPSDIVVFSTGVNTADPGLPAVRLLADNDATALDVRSAQAGVGIAVDAPGEASELQAVSVSASGTTTTVVVGAGTKLESWTQRGGANTLRAVDTVDLVVVSGGELRTEGAMAITAAEVRGGTATFNHVGYSTVDAIDELDVYGGAVRSRGAGAARDWDTVRVFGGTVSVDTTVVAIGSLSGLLTISA